MTQQGAESNEGGQMLPRNSQQNLLSSAFHKTTDGRPEVMDTWVGRGQYLALNLAKVYGVPYTAPKPTITESLLICIGIVDQESWDIARGRISRPETRIFVLFHLSLSFILEVKLRWSSQRWECLPMQYEEFRWRWTQQLISSKVESLRVQSMAESGLGWMPDGGQSADRHQILIHLKAQVRKHGNYRGSL